MQGMCHHPTRDRESRNILRYVIKVGRVLSILTVRDTPAAQFNTEFTSDVVRRLELLRGRAKIDPEQGSAVKSRRVLRSFQSPDFYSDFMLETSSADHAVVTYIGGPVQTRTADLLRVKQAL